jgi:adenine deaminase
MATSFSITARYIDIFQQTIKPSIITIANGKIASILPTQDQSDLPYLLAGFVDAHVHIESSMLLPSAFARLAVVHGTVGTVSDPHEIGNVMGTKGVEYMLDNAALVPFHCCFGAPSCVPATIFETAGATINAEQIKALLEREDIYYLTEMMNYPGVLNGEEEVIKKITHAKNSNKPIDGHAPGLKGALAEQYIAAGISTDHECFTIEEALDKLKFGMKILIREGSAAKNFNALIDLMDTHSDLIMFCSDDKHADALVEGHINQLVKRALLLDKPLFKVLQAACINPVLHYNLPIGLTRIGDNADFILVDSITEFNILETFINGISVAKNKISNIPHLEMEVINQFNTVPVHLEQLKVKAVGPTLKVIEALNGELITHQLMEPAKIMNGCIESNLELDTLKMVCLNRYQNADPAIAFIKNFGLKKGAIASTVAHDSHNIIAVGVDDDSLVQVINELIKLSGGIAVCKDGKVESLALPVAGLMSPDDGYKVAARYTELDLAAKSLGSALDAPFMTLSFMALLVIPALKLSDKGLFDGSRFCFTSLSE